MPVHYLKLIVAAMALSFGTMAQAGLTINEGTTSPSAKIGWGGADSLSEARTIMYANKGRATKTITNIDNGYNGNAGYNTYADNSYGSSNNSYGSYNNYGNSGFSNPYYSGNSYDTLPISTRSSGVVVLDLQTGQPIYEKNANTARPIASITKILTAMVVLDAGQDMREEIVLKTADTAKKYYSNYEKTSSTRLKPGDRMNRAELLLMMLMKSENPAAKALARNYPGGYHAFINAMNQKAKSLGMYSSHFSDPSGLDKRNVASPNDLVKMIKAAGNYDVIRRFSTTKSYDFFVANYSAGNRVYKANNTSKLIRSGDYPIGISKTGFIRESGRCVVMETRVNNRPAIIVILGANSSATRWGDAENILHSLAMRRSV